MLLNVNLFDEGIGKLFDINIMLIKEILILFDIDVSNNMKRNS